MSDPDAPGAANCGSGFSCGIYTGDPKYLSSAYTTTAQPGSGYLAQSAQVRVAAVPEPAAWATMTLGMGAIGLAMRRRKAVSTTFANA